MPVVQASYAAIAQNMIQFQQLESQLANLAALIAKQVAAAGINQWNSNPLPTNLTLDGNGNIQGFNFDPTAAQNCYYSILQFQTYDSSNAANLTQVNC